MLRHILRATLKQRGRGIFFLVGLLALSTGLSTYVSASQNATLRVNASLDQHWRGAYDLLVRHPDAVQATEKLYGIVESNYLSAGESGISVTQWKTIQQLEGVEVAAPVATIGYLRDASGRVNLNVPNPREQTFYRITTTITSTNGYRETAFLNATDYVLLQPVEATTTTTTTVGNRPSREALKQVVLSTADHSMMTSKQIRFSFRTLPPLWTLVTGIDPASEKALTGLDTAVIEGRYLADNDGIATEKVPNPDKTTYTNDEEGTRQWLEDSGNYAMNPDGPNIPVLIAASAYMSLPLTVWIDGLEMLSGEEIETIQRESPLKAIESFDRSTHTNEPESGFMREGLDAMQLTSVSSIAHGGVDLGAQFRPLHSLAVSASITSTGLMLQTSARYGSFDAVGMENAYRPGAIEYEPNQAPFNAEGVLSLAAVPKDDAQTIITGTGEVAFRSLPLFPPAMAAPTEDSGDDNYRTPFTFHEVGTYDLNSLPDYVRNPDPLTYVPLGIYTPPLVQLVKDADGNPLPQGPVTLGPTLNPASFIPGPPLALTNIAAARFFRGEDCIDAIRVRVEGINRYTPENIAKVESVAAEIIRTTGLHVDIVAGSSPQKVLVYIPGSPDGTVPPLGYVEEPWTTLGAAASIEQGIDRASVLMLGATGIAGLLYLVSQSLLSTLSRRKELALLQAVGWRRRHVAALVVGEASILGVLSGVCASVLAVVVAWGLGLAAPPEQAAGVGVVVFALYVAASLGPALWVTNQPVAELLQRGEVALPTAGRIS